MKTLDITGFLRKSSDYRWDALFSSNMEFPKIFGCQSLIPSFLFLFSISAKAEAEISGKTFCSYYGTAYVFFKSLFKYR